MKGRTGANARFKTRRCPRIHLWPGRPSQTLALVLWALGLVLWAGWLVYEQPVRAYLYPSEQVSVFQHALDVLLELLTYQGLTTIGSIIILRSSNRRFGWLMLATGFFNSLVEFTAYYSAYALLVAPDAGLPFGLLAGWVQHLWIVPFSLLYIYLPLLFPDGDLPSRRWWPVFWLITLFLSLFVLLLAFVFPELTNLFLDAETPVRNPFAIIGAELITPRLRQAALPILFVPTAASLLAAVGSVIVRWRRAGGKVRQQIKWVLYFLALLAALRAADWVVGGLILPSEQELVFEKYIRNAQAFVLVGLEVALGIAVLKYRLYDIDLVIRRTLQYTALTGILALLYFGGIVLLQSVFRSVTGQADSPLITVITTLGIAALFNPLRRRIQEAVDRRFYREKYDAQRTLAGFATFARDEVDMNRLGDTLCQMVQETMQPTYLSVWLRDPEAASDD